MTKLLLLAVLAVVPDPVIEPADPVIECCPPTVVNVQASIDALPPIRFVLPAEPDRSAAPVTPRLATNAAGDHWCPRCGSGRWTVQHRTAPGWHSHLCGRCGLEFWHPNASNRPAAVSTDPVTPIWSTRTPLPGGFSDCQT